MSEELKGLVAEILTYGEKSGLTKSEKLMILAKHTRIHEIVDRGGEITDEVFTQMSQDARTVALMGFLILMAQTLE